MKHTHASHEQIHHEDSDRVIERTIEILRSRGERITVARIDIVRELALQVDHRSAEDIALAVALRNPDVHRATVYRTLDRFDELGLLSKLPGSTGGSTYHLLSDHDNHHSHVHAQCRRCQKVVHLSADAFTQVTRELQPEFTFEPSYSALMGICSECQSALE